MKIPSSLKSEGHQTNPHVSTHLQGMSVWKLSIEHVYKRVCDPRPKAYADLLELSVHREAILAPPSWQKIASRDER